MPNAYTLMTALPPTKGHINLIEFTAELGLQAHVIVCTQPDEPFALERYGAIRVHFAHDPMVTVHHLHRPLEQNPQAVGFWDMWVEIMTSFGMQKGDIFVSSEAYGQTMADKMSGIFMPYDPNRELYYTKATLIRKDPAKYFSDIAPEFQQYLRKTVTFFGAESTGKTTTSKRVSYEANGHWLFEYARPYLEITDRSITKEKMDAIWHGQGAIQAHGRRMLDKPWVVQDTDLFSTIGYWEFPHWQEALGPVPERLIKEAIHQKSDLYIIMSSNIPFEKDPIRYKSDEGVREGSDEYWIGVCEKYGLNYKVVSAEDFDMRTAQALDFMAEAFDQTAQRITYERRNND